MKKNYPFFKTLLRVALFLFCCTAFFAHAQGGYIITYNANNNAIPAEVDVTQTVDVVIDTATTYSPESDCAFTAPAGKHFVGWRVNSNGTGDFYAAGAEYKITGNLTLYAQWELDGRTERYVVVKNSAPNTVLAEHYLLQSAVNFVNTHANRTQEFTIIATENDNDVTNGSTTPVSLASGLNITFTSVDGVNPNTILQPNVYVIVGSSTNGRHFIIDIGAQLTLVNVILKGNALKTGMNTINGGVFVRSTGTLLMNDGAVIKECFGQYNLVGDLQGGGATVLGTFIMNGGAIKDNFGNGHVLTYNNGKFIMNGGKISGGGWGVFSFRNGGSFTMNGGEISGITGAGVYAQESTLTMNGGKITNIVGVGVFVTQTNFTMTGGEISGNTAMDDYNIFCYGAGVLVSHSNFTMTGGKISNNTSFLNILGLGGGGVAVVGGTFKMSGGKISNNMGPFGAGVYLNSTHAGKDCTFTMTGGEISGNTATFGGGGGVDVYGAAVFIMEEGEEESPVISGNTAVNGGGVYIDNYSYYYKYWYDDWKDYESDGEEENYNDKISYFTMSGGTIIDNTATAQGGGVYTRGEVTITDGTIADNHAIEGGGVYVASYIGDYEEYYYYYENEPPYENDYYYEKWYYEYMGTLNMTGGTIHNNTATGDGGGIFTQDFNNLEVGTNAHFSDNTAQQAYWLDQKTNGGYDPGRGEVSFNDLKNVIHPAQIKTSSRSNPPIGEDSFQYLYNNYDINMGGIEKENDTIFTQRCAQDSITLVCDVVNGGVDPYYQWILNGKEVVGANDSTFK